MSLRNFNLIIFVWACIYAGAATPAELDSARTLYARGEYTAAIAPLKQLLARQPKDNAANLLLGMSHYRLGQFDDAIAPLRAAESTGNAEAAHLLADIYLKEYMLDQAANYANRWKTALEKKDQPSTPATAMQSRINNAKNMLDRVEKIKLIDTIRVDSAEFFARYILSRDAGTLNAPADLPYQWPYGKPTVIYAAENGNELMWGALGTDSIVTLVSANILDDGTIDKPLPVSDLLNDGGDADYPYVLQDGSTIYYAANGESSIGGYDIYMTRRSADGEVLQPQNVGMPYNSPYNDYMLVIDESRNLGWFASDREHIPGKVTIYVFEPKNLRENYSPEEENIRNLALLRDIEPDGNYEGHEDWIPVLREEADFELSMGNGQVYTSLLDFRNAQARQVMRQVLEQQRLRAEQLDRLAQLRASYTPGSTSAGEIHAIEEEIDRLDTEIRRLTNKAITLELN